MSNKSNPLKKGPVGSETPIQADAAKFVDPCQPANDEHRLFYSRETNVPFLVTGEKIVNGINHIQLTNQINGDAVLFAKAALIQKFSQEEGDPNQITKRRMMKLSQICSHLFR